MPIERVVASDRVEMIDSISAASIDDIVRDEKVKVVQASEPVTVKSWKLINERLIPRRPDIEIRIYGHYSGACDLRTLNYLPNVEHLSVDCLPAASGIESLASLDRLRSLSVGIYSLESFDFLDLLPSSLESLSLGATRSKRPKLNGLRRFENLRTLSIEGQNKNLELIGELPLLEKLVLRSVSLKDIGFLRRPKNLWSLAIKLGGIKDIGALEGLANLKHLELWRIRGLSDISVISSLTGLQFLFLQTLKNIVAFPDTSRLEGLRRIYLDTMKGLMCLDGLFKAPALEEYIHVCAQNMTPEQYAPLLDLGTLKRASFGFGSDRKNRIMERMMREKGIKQYSPAPFQFT